MCASEITRDKINDEAEKSQLNPLFVISEILSSLSNPETLLTCSPQITTEVPYANRSDPGETPCKSVSHPDLSCLTIVQYFHRI